MTQLEETSSWSLPSSERGKGTQQTSCVGPRMSLLSSVFRAHASAVTYGWKTGYFWVSWRHFVRFQHCIAFCFSSPTVSSKTVSTPQTWGQNIMLIHFLLVRVICTILTFLQNVSYHVHITCLSWLREEEGEWWRHNSWARRLPGQWPLFKTALQHLEALKTLFQKVAVFVAKKT